MNTGLGQASARDVQLADVKRMRGLHEQAAEHLNRLCSVNESLRQILCRVRGNQPEQAGSVGKNPETPSIVELQDSISREVCRLEQQLNEFAGVIG